MTIRISTISIKAFRGIPELEIDAERRNLLIKGDNGSGKSSIIEALEFFFTGGVSHLEGTQGVSLVKHGPHSHHTKDEVRISLTFDPGSIALTRTMHNDPPPNRNLESYLNAARKATFILRRSQILEFVNGEPADRYKAIASIIGLEPLDTIELEIQRLRDEMKGDEDARLESISDVLGSLSRTLGVTIGSFEEVLPTLNRKAAKLGFPNLTKLEEIREYNLDLYGKIKKKSDEQTTAKDLEDLIPLVQESIISRERIDRVKSFGTKANVLIESNAGSSVKLLELLTVGKEMISAGGSSHCPLCGQIIETNTLLSTLESRRKTVAQLSVEASSVRQTYSLVEKDIEETIRNLDLIVSEMAHLEGFSSLAGSMEAESLFLTQFVARLTRAKDLIEPLPLAEFDQHSLELRSLLTKSKNKAESDLQGIGLTEAEKRLVDFIATLGVVDEKVRLYKSLKSNYEMIKKYHELAQRMYDSFSVSKKGKTHEIYVAITNDVQTFFNRLHPNEESRNIQLDIVPTRRASTQLLVDTLGMSQQDPRGLESEGHLDSLGICIFLAFVRKFNIDIPLVLLDDVVTTLDSAHRGRLAELLIQEFSDKQLVVTTSDNIWYEQFIAAERAHKRENDYKHMEIVGWDLATGPRILDYKPTWELIEEKLKSGDKLGAGNQGRSYLEWVLQRLCEAMQVDVRFKMRPRYEIGDLFPPAKSKIAKMVDDQAFRAIAERAFIELEKTIPMANILSHSNPFGEELVISEVERFCLAVRNLHLVFSCSECGGFLQYHREFGVIQCSNKKCSRSLEIKVKD